MAGELSDEDLMNIGADLDFRTGTDMARIGRDWDWVRMFARRVIAAERKRLAALIRVCPFHDECHDGCNINRAVAARIVEGENGAIDGDR